jgi:hypothetical protein
MVGIRTVADMGMTTNFDRAYWYSEHLRRARYYWSRARHKLRVGDRFEHRWNMQDAIFNLKEAKNIKRAM